MSFVITPLLGNLYDSLEQLNDEFILERGVLQGSVLSPALFLLVMNPLLRQLEHNSLGPSVHGTYAGAFAHLMTYAL